MSQTLGQTSSKRKEFLRNSDVIGHLVFYLSVLDVFITCFSYNPLYFFFNLQGSLSSKVAFIPERRESLVSLLVLSVFSLLSECYRWVWQSWDSASIVWQQQFLH